jgi:hypothetical protein
MYDSANSLWALTSHDPILLCGMFQLRRWSASTMFKKLIAALGIGMAATGSVSAVEGYKPYAEPHVNFLYNLLFCDDISLFKTPEAQAAGGVLGTLLAEPPDKTTLRKIADDPANEGRVRALAYNRLRAASEKVPEKKLLGVIVEVRLEQGLDVLAAFSEGGVRYLNQSGKVAIFEGDENSVAGLAKELIAVSQPVVDQIGPWDKQRLPPPKAGNVRLTFLVSDGLYFGEGAFDLLQRDPMAGPVLAKASQLLQQVVALGTQ